MTYAGIGSRETPENVLTLMHQYARDAAARGDVLRTGGADGADRAFLEGCGAGPHEPCLPWQGFEGHYADCPPITDAALRFARRFHPAWHRCTPGTRKKHARNGYVVLGPTLKDPVEVVVCWTPGGSGSGGTGQALRIAKAFDIKVIDLGLWQDRLALECSDEAYQQMLRALDIPFVG